MEVGSCRFKIPTKLLNDKTAANRDSGTNDLLVSQVLRMNELQVWFLAEHFVDTPLVHS